MIDLHTHILPGIDDGASTLEISMALLRDEVRQGIQTIVLTPHFYPEETTLALFLEKRASAYQVLRQAVAKEALPVELRLGAEVHFSPSIVADPLPLCIEGTHYMLVEFSSRRLPILAKETFYALAAQGITPIIAHGERYLYAGIDPLLEYLLSGDTLLQVDTPSLVHEQREIKKRTQQLLQHRMVHLLGSDTHSPDRRPPVWNAMYRTLRKKGNAELLSIWEQNALAVLQDRNPFVDPPLPFKKTFGRFFNR